MCCGSYRGRLRAIKLLLWLHGSAEYIKIGLWWLERLKTNSCFDGFRPRLRLTWMLWWLQGLNEDNKDGFCGHRDYGTNMIIMMATWGRPRTTRVMCWLQRLTEYQHGGFCVRWG